MKNIMNAQEETSIMKECRELMIVMRVADYGNAYNSVTILRMKGMSYRIVANNATMRRFPASKNAAKFLE